MRASLNPRIRTTPPTMMAASMLLAVLLLSAVAVVLGIDADQWLQAGAFVAVALLVLFILFGYVNTRIDRDLASAVRTAHGSTSCACDTGSRAWTR